MLTCSLKPKVGSGSVFFLFKNRIRPFFSWRSDPFFLLLEGWIRVNSTRNLGCLWLPGTQLSRRLSAWTKPLGEAVRRVHGICVGNITINRAKFAPWHFTLNPGVKEFQADNVKTFKYVKWWGAIFLFNPPLSFPLKQQFNLVKFYYRKDIFHELNWSQKSLTQH